MKHNYDLPVYNYSLLAGIEDTTRDACRRPIRSMDADKTARRKVIFSAIMAALAFVLVIGVLLGVGR